MNWQGYWKWLICTLAGLAFILAGAIWIVDPYDNLPITLPLKRMPLAQNQRFSYPAIARKQVFDSLIIGTSTTRLLRPDVFNEAFIARFANLSMNSATAYEQARMTEVFARHHGAQKNIIIGLDIVWCEVGEELTKYTFRRFPEWMYDANPWNDIAHLLTFKTFENVGRQAGYLLGLRKARYGYDGYANFLPSPDEYELNKARKKIYGSTEPRQRKVPALPPSSINKKRAKWTYPTHPLLDGLLNSLPAKTKKTLFFVPYHFYHQPVPNTVSAAQWSECKQRIVKMAGKYSNTVVLDFMIPSPITMRDENYWDVLHYTVEIADKLAPLIARGASGKPAPRGEYTVLELP